MFEITLTGTRCYLSSRSLPRLILHCASLEKKKVSCRSRSDPGPSRSFGGKSSSGVVKMRKLITILSYGWRWTITVDFPFGSNL
jgi:hypothetical protein